MNSSDRKEAMRRRTKAFAGSVVRLYVSLERFRHEVSHVIERIAADPFLWRERLGGFGSIYRSSVPPVAPSILQPAS